MQEIGIAETREHVLELNERLIAGVDELGATVVTPRQRERHGALICIRSTDVDDLVAALARDGIVTSSRDGNLRISAHCYNSTDGRRRRPRRAGASPRFARLTMEQRALGRTGLSLSRLCLGCGNFGGIGSAPAFFGAGETEAEAFELMDAAIAMGINLFDTADAYGGGRSETWIGRWRAARGTAGRC